MVNGDRLLGLRPVDAERGSDPFDPFRCGLDHLSFGVASKADLEIGEPPLMLDLLHASRGATVGLQPPCRHYTPFGVLPSCLPIGQLHPSHSHTTVEPK